ncbi:GlxA family transcriptional regulator [Anaeromyxobacter paludicola]|uniref:AraC family transcriptional regulator n=1 Tax=Anaeromyxobacter paludicola TaxID=2918171 RepID=A0ABM7XDR8_9BACT|nr:helix-turn-helix domain-containing protein [Anaeromyxobacter paludicola]BDG10024.1 AraC family transcriptional regulator [Anaeromyxobacter paludicola]
MTTPVWLVATSNVLLLDLAGPAETFRLARRAGAPLSLHLAGPRPEVRTSVGLSLGALEPLPASLPEGAVVMVAGCEDSARHYAGPEAAELVAWLRRLPAGTRLASVCSAALLLGRAGRFDGRACTTHHTLAERLRREAPRARVLEDRIFVEDGPAMSSAGITAGIDLALHLVEGIGGPQVAQAVAREMVVFLRRSGDDPQLSPWLAHRNHVHPAVHRVQDAIAREPQRRWSRAELAGVGHVSERHLSRLFQAHAGVSVADYRRALCVARARRLLADERVTVERAAELAGFGSARELRRAWRRHAGGTPTGRR